MANNKKFYWLKLKTDFFNQREIKKLRKIAGGDTYTIIYLKLQLLSIKTDGVIKFEGTEKNIVEQLELELDEDFDNIQVTLSFLQANGLLEEINDSDYLMPQVCDNIGKEGSSAERVRKHREKQKALQCNGTETNSNTEIEKRDREKRKEIDSENLKPKDIISLYKKLITSENSYVREQTSYNQLCLLSKDLEKIAIGIKNFAESNHDFKYSLPNFIKDGIYLDYQKVKIQEKKGNLIIPSSLIGKNFVYEGVTIVFRENGYYKQEKDWEVTEPKAVKEMIDIYEATQKEIESERMSGLLSSTNKAQYNFGGK